MRPAVLEATGIVKTFDRTQALRGADFSLAGGEVHALLGANGAGKSTLSKIISGLVPKDAGTIVLRGEPLDLHSTRDGLNAGIAMVMQETSLAPHLSVLENIFLPELGRPGLLSYKRLRARAEEVLAGLGQGATLPLDREVLALSAAQRQLVEIAKALALDADLIIFDEPTASLSPTEVEHLFDVMGTLRAQGRAIVFVSHRLEEVFAISDRVSVMREGRTIAGGIDAASLSQAELIRLMVGQELGSVYAGRSVERAPTRAPVLEVTDLCAPPLVRKVSFAVRPGEIVGLGGLVGAGRSETLEAIFGLRPRASGDIRLAGKPFAPRRPADAIRSGLGFVAEDRRVQGIVPDLSVRENLLLAHLGARRGLGLGYGARQAQIDDLLRRLALPGHRILDSSMLEFSGGMQQKIIIGRWLLLKPAVLLLDEPTKGVDIGTRASIYAILREIAADGVGIVVVSSDFEELLGLCHRIVVMSDGTSLADLPAEHLDEEKLTLLAAPRTSMERTSRMLEDLAAEHGGAGFWALVDQDRICCLAAAVADRRADPGFKAGDMPAIAETAIPTALKARADDFVREPDGSRRTLVIPIASHRGHDLGAVGLTLDATRPVPPAEEVRARVAAHFATAA